MRAELLFALMNGYHELSSGSGAAQDEAAQGNDADADGGAPAEPAGRDDLLVASDAADKPVTSAEYLKSDLTYAADKLLDSDLNGVMMAWETDIMRRSVDALVPGAQPGKRILNIGFGMGIVDGLFADLEPSRHHIIEAHPSVLDQISGPGSRFGPAWERSGPRPGAFKVFAGRCQDVVPRLVEQGEAYDAIYFDTFGEDYALLRMFFTEHIPALLDQGGRFSFNGLGADRRICYDVYVHVVEIHCADAGLDVEWHESDVDMAGLDEEGKGQWEGVRRRYWTLDSESPPPVQGSRRSRGP